jgi:nicotinamidase/pyrazinamidase
MDMKALVIVDLQNDFVSGGTLEVPEGGQVVPVVNRLQQVFELVVATQDWHPLNHGSFAANHPGRSPGDVVDLAGFPQVLWPVHCVQGSLGADLVPDLDKTRIHKVFVKGTDPLVDSYSGFFDNGRQRSTGLGEFLQDTGVTQCYVLGLATDYCVKFTALDARRLGFSTFLVIDGCRGVGIREEDIEHAFEEMREAGVEEIYSEELSHP